MVRLIYYQISNEEVPETEDKANYIFTERYQLSSKVYDFNSIRIRFDTPNLPTVISTPNQ